MGTNCLLRTADWFRFNHFYFAEGILVELELDLGSQLFDSSLQLFRYSLIECLFWQCSSPVKRKWIQLVSGLDQQPVCLCSFHYILIDKAWVELCFELVNYLGDSWIIDLFAAIGYDLYAQSNPEWMNGFMEWVYVKSFPSYDGLSQRSDKSELLCFSFSQTTLLPIVTTCGGIFDEKLKRKHLPERKKKS